MNTYVVLINYTQHGIDTIKDALARTEKVSKMLEKAGARIKDYYLTLGEYDYVVIFEAPDDKTMARMLIEIGRLGAVRTKTMRAFTQAESKEILSELS
jgi:uncharacterized protein with GYD domain